MQSLGVYARIGLYIDAKDCGKGTAMKIERHETGSRMSKAVIHGDTVYLAGIVADSPKDKSVAEQTRSILSQIAQTPSAPLPEHQSKAIRRLVVSLWGRR